jgi:predicted anti-sigma-YlaC factor YlaD
MDCRRAEELLSDHYEGSLTPLVKAEVDEHLEECPRCRALLEALGRVVDALHSFPLLEPSADLADRAAVAALRRPRAAVPDRRHALPSWLQAAAAGIALVVAGTFLLVTGPEAPTRAATRLVDRTVTAGSFLLERKDRLVEDVRILGVVIGTAFEGRLDRMNDRMNDYRQLLERRRNASEEEKKRSTGGPLSRLFAETFRTGDRRDA